MGPHEGLDFQETVVPRKELLKMLLGASTPTSSNTCLSTTLPIRINVKIRYSLTSQELQLICLGPLRGAESDDCPMGPEVEGSSDTCFLELTTVYIVAKG